MGEEQHTVFLENAVLKHWPDYAAKHADATVRLTRATLNPHQAHPFCVQEFSINRRGRIDRLKQLP